MKNIGYFEKIKFDEFLRCVKDSPLAGNETDEEFIGYQYYDRIILPKRATRRSAGYDFFYPLENIQIKPGETIVIPTGIRVVIHREDWFLGLYPKSGLSFKYKLKLDDTVGIVDADYINASNGGHIFAKITNENKQNKVLTLTNGASYMQGIFQEYGLVCGDNVTTERVGGFGSTQH